jgi:predicted outer membrane repeat protein
MHNPSCDSISWDGGSFSANVAADGGAIYLTQVTERKIMGSADYHNNRVRIIAS